MNDNIIKLTAIYKIYKMGDTEVKANENINIDIKKGEFIVIMGASGSGKSTLMNIIGCLDRPTSGSYILDGQEVSKLNDDELSAIRNQKIGFVFQKFHLLSNANALENVELPMIYSGIHSNDRKEIAIKSLSNVGLGERLTHNPNELSGGQMQRVAIARALVNKPSIILADEPTGNLDTKSGAEIMALFQELHRMGRTIVLITHNPEMSRYGTRVIKLEDGKVISDNHVIESERIIIASEEKKEALISRIKSNGRMNILQSFKVAWTALKANKLRSLLTMLGIIIGVSAVIVMTSIGQGTRENVLKQINSMGSNLIFVRPNYSRNVVQGAILSDIMRLTMKDVNAIKEKCNLVIGVAPQITRTVTTRYLANSLAIELIGTTSDFLNVRGFNMDKGRFFSEEDMENRNTVCVIGSDLAEDLFGKGENPIGKTIKVSMGSTSKSSGGKSIVSGGIRLTVIGVLKKKGMTFGQDNDKNIVTPLSVVQYRLFHQKYIGVIFIQAINTDKIKDAINEIKWAILPLHDNDPQNFQVESQEEILQRVENTMGAFTFMLAGIAFISLLVGGIGIMNIMLVSVTERTREIGLRKAIGARNRDILFQFLIESLVMGITGGIIGILIGIGLSKVYALITAQSALRMLSKTFISWESIILSFTFSAMVGIFFGIYPARKAANLDPIDALRYE